VDYKELFAEPAGVDAGGVETDEESKENSFSDTAVQELEQQVPYTQNRVAASSPGAGKEEL
jgi:hypothetical protein